MTFVNPRIWDGEGNGTPLQCSCQENPMNGGARKAGIHGVDEGRTRLSDFPFTFHFHALEEEMATHSSVLAWRIPGTGEPGGLPSMGSHRVGHDWSDLAAAAAGYGMDVTDSFWVGGKTVISEIITTSPKMFTSKSLKRVKCEWHREVKVVEGINFTNQQILARLF